MLAIFCIEENQVHFCWCDGIVDKFSWICYPLDDINVFFCWHHAVQFGVIAGWVEFAGDLLNVSPTATNDGSNRIHIWIVASNCHLGPIACLTGHAHDFHSAIIDFRDFLFHETLDHFWMTAAYKYVDPASIVLYLVNIDLNTVMGLEDFTRNLVLLGQLSFDGAKVDIDEAIIKTLHRPRHDLPFMFLIGIIGDGPGLLAHFFHDGLLGRLGCHPTKLTRSLFELNLIAQFIG